MRVKVTREQVERAFDAVKGESVFSESSALVDAGRLPAEMIQAMCLRPEFLASFCAMSNAVYPGGLVERDIKELIILESSRQNACQFCTDSHIAIARSLGLSDEPLRLLDESAALNERQRLALEFTRAVMADSNRVSDDLWVRLTRVFRDEELVELTLMIGYINMLNMFNNTLRVAYRDDYEVLADQSTKQPRP